MNYYKKYLKYKTKYLNLVQGGANSNDKHSLEGTKTDKDKVSETEPRSSKPKACIDLNDSTEILYNEQDIIKRGKNSNLYYTKDGNLIKLWSKHKDPQKNIKFRNICDNQITFLTQFAGRKGVHKIINCIKDVHSFGYIMKNDGGIILEQYVETNKYSDNFTHNMIEIYKKLLLLVKEQDKIKVYPVINAVNIMIPSNRDPKVINWPKNQICNHVKGCETEVATTSELNNDKKPLKNILLDRYLQIYYLVKNILAKPIEKYPQLKSDMDLIDKLIAIFRKYGYNNDDLNELIEKLFQLDITHDKKQMNY